MLPVKGHNIEMNKRSYRNQQPLRIPGGWTVIFNKFEDIEPETLPAEDEAWLFAFNEDILYIRSDVNRRKTEIALDLGWYPDSDPDGQFVIQAILNGDWNKPLLKFCSRNKDEIVRTLEKWLWVDFRS